MSPSPSEHPLPMTAPRSCAATTKRGTPCKANPLEGHDVCLAHADADTRASVGFVPEAGNLGGRPPKPKVTEVLRERVEERADEIIDAMLNGLTASRGIVVSLGGGQQTVEEVPDHSVRLQAARDLLDRVYGKPKQSQEISGPDGGPIDLQHMSDDDLRAQAAALRSRREP